MTSPEGSSPHPVHDRQVIGAEAAARIMGSNYVNYMRPPTDEQIAANPDLAARRKNYSQIEWDNRNN